MAIIIGCEAYPISIQATYGALPWEQYVAWLTTY